MPWKLNRCQKKSRKLKSLKKMITENKNKILDDMVTKYDQTVAQGRKIGRDALTKIEKTTKTRTELIKSQPYWESLKGSSQKFKEKSIEQEKKLKKQTPNFIEELQMDSSTFLKFL